MFIKPGYLKNDAICFSAGRFRESLQMQREKKNSTTPSNKAYPFTVEVILEEEQNSLKKLDFSPKIGCPTTDEIHSNAANILNSSGFS